MVYLKWSKYQISMLNLDLIRNYHKIDVKKTLNGPVLIFLIIWVVAYLKWSRYQISMPNLDPSRKYHKNDVKKTLNGL